MQPSNKIQLLVIGLSIGLVALIFYLGRNNPAALAPGTEESGGEEPFQPIETSSGEGSGYKSGSDELLLSIINNEKGKLTASRNATLDSLEALLTDGEVDSVRFLEQYALELEDALARSAAGFYYQLLAEKVDTEDYWYHAANNYVNAQSTVKDTESFNLLVRRSVHALNKVLEHNPENLDAKAELAVSYFESNRDPMKGVGMLRENYQMDPEHEKTLYYLGMINMRTGQYDRARERIEKLVSLQPENAFNYYYLGQIYLNEGENQKALEAFKNYRSRVQDTGLQQQATHMINSIKQNL